ncbi:MULTISPECIES: hypothetical protein [unclassified Wolbachia]|uniref:hypothetical protein n=1 Tax=unclassified Wolbachia TaxID=2640676 RepID=UPI001AE18A3F|nr:MULTISPECIES: hypothetical protein [unclassified Wolbachia]QTP61611.1 hypothetical protein HUB92_01310 [Wolbachia endosymbiont of Wiebesia pumilae]
MILYSAKPIHANPTIPTTAATTGIFMIYNATQFTNNTAPTLPNMIACLCCSAFADRFLSAASPLKHGSAEDGLSALSTEVGSTVVSTCAFSLFSHIG